jgi:hypothetical protein
MHHGARARPARVPRPPAGPVRPLPARGPFMRARRAPHQRRPVTQRRDDRRLIPAARSTARTSRATPPARTRRARDSRDTPALTRASLAAHAAAAICRPMATCQALGAARQLTPPPNGRRRRSITRTAGCPVVANRAGYGWSAVRDRTPPRVHMPLAHSGLRRARRGCARIALRHDRGSADAPWH